jgi:hypothetical protein
MDLHARDFHLITSKTIRPRISPRPDLYGTRCTSDRAAISGYNATAIANVKLPVPHDRQRGPVAAWRAGFTHRAPGNGGIECVPTPRREGQNHCRAAAALVITGWLIVLAIAFLSAR